MNHQAIEAQLAAYVGCKTTAGNHEEFNKCYTAFLQTLPKGLFIEKKYVNDGVTSWLLLTKDTVRPDLLLYVHIDVVPGSDGLFTLQKVGDSYLGRGVSDMKFALPVYTAVINRLVESQQLPDSLGILIVSDEEMGGARGSGYLVEKVGLNPKVVFVPDGGDNWQVVIEAKGVTAAEIVVTGKSAHGSKPWEGKNAIVGMAEVINYLSEQYPVPKNDLDWKTTINLGLITGGTAANQVAERASLTIDVRATKDVPASQVLADLKARFPDIQINPIMSGAKFEIDPQDTYIQSWIKLLEKQNLVTKPETALWKETGSGDHRYFRSVGSSVVVSKPKGGRIHTEDEWISAQSLETYIALVTQWISGLQF